MIATQMIVLFGLMFIGYIANKGGVLDANSDRSMSKLLVNIAIPATIIASSVGQGMEDKMRVFTVFVTALAVFIITPVVSHFLVRILKMNSTYKLMINYSNLGFMGIPIISSVYGENATFYVSIYMMLFNISLFSYGISLVQEGKPNHSGMLKNLLSPGIISAIIAVCLFLFEVTLPSPLYKILSYTGNITTPLAMIVIGSTLASVNIRAIFKDKSIYIFTVLKVVILPILVWIILGVFVHDAVILGIAVILSSLPTAGNVSMLCMEYKGDVELVTKGIFMSTICSLLTIPVWLMLF